MLCMYECAYGLHARVYARYVWTRLCMYVTLCYVCLVRCVCMLNVSYVC